MMSINSQKKRLLNDKTTQIVDSSLNKSVLFKCDHCTKTFKRKIGLNQYKITHSTLRPFKCDQCTKTFKRKIELKQHKTTHSTLRPFKCGRCVKTFKNRQGLKQHMGCVHIISSCSMCNYTTDVKSELDTHMMGHADEALSF